MCKNPVPKGRAPISKELSAVRRRLAVLEQRIRRSRDPKQEEVAEALNLIDNSKVFKVLLGGSAASREAAKKASDASREDGMNVILEWANGKWRFRALPEVIRNATLRKHFALKWFALYKTLEKGYRRGPSGTEKPHLQHAHKESRARLGSKIEAQIHGSRHHHVETGVVKAQEQNRDTTWAYRCTVRGFPFVSWGKYKKRLIRTLLDFRATHPQEWKQLWPRQMFLVLPALGIPAREIVGPYTYRRPADYVKDAQGVRSSTPNVSDLITEANQRGGHHLDPYDEDLGRAIHAYVTTHGNQTPSIQTVLNINRQIERERLTKGKTEAFEVMEAWWDAAVQADLWPMVQKIQASLPEGWAIFDGSTTMKEELWYRVRTWNLCTIEQMKYWVKQDPKQWGCYYLILATDRKRGTVVGLTSGVVCRHAHWCTGVNNKIDAEAYDLFGSERKWWWKQEVQYNA
jgi:hypothetical protein